MKAIFNTLSGEIAGYTSDLEFVPTGGFAVAVLPLDWDESDRDSAMLVDGVIVLNPTRKLDLAKAARKIRTKSEAAILIDATAWKLERAREQESAGWATMAGINAVLAERESIRRSSTAADAAIDAMTDIASVLNFTWSVDVVALVPNRTEWLVDIGPFFDRFGAAKIATLSSINETVQAIVNDCQSRKWIDLQRPDLALAMDVLVDVALIDALTKSAILATPVAPDENLALRKLYFS